MNTKIENANQTSPNFLVVKALLLNAFKNPIEFLDIDNIAHCIALTAKEPALLILEATGKVEKTKLREPTEIEILVKCNEITRRVDYLTWTKEILYVECEEHAQILKEIVSRKRTIEIPQRHNEGCHYSRSSYNKRLDYEAKTQKSEKHSIEVEYGFWKISSDSYESWNNQQEQY